MSRSDGMTYAPQGRAELVVAPGEVVFAAAALDHGHIYGMCNGLTEAGAELGWVYDPDPAKAEAFRKRFPGVRVARALDEVLDDPDVRLSPLLSLTSVSFSFGVFARVPIKVGGEVDPSRLTPFTSHHLETGAAQVDVLPLESGHLTDPQSGVCA